MGLSQTPSLGEALDATQKVWTAGGNASWFGQTSSTHDGVDAARSGAITINQQTWMETTVTGPVTVAYWWKVDSEAGYDFLSFAVDGVAQLGMISGAVGWQSKTNSIAPGVHTCRWTFANDESYAEGANAGWVDQVQFLQLYAPSIAILGADQTVIPQDSSTPFRANGTYFGSAVAITGSVVHTFSVTNSGNAELTVSSVAVAGSGASDFTVLSYPAKITPGASSNLVLRFNPSIAGIRKATLTIKNNDTVKSNYVFAVEGYGLSFYPSAPRYVWANSPASTPPYTNWQTAAHTIQDAVDIAAEGDTVWVTNGVYASGGRPVFGMMTNRVAITTPITVRSVNGSANTVIVGAGPLGDSAVRCVYMSSDAWLLGFHLTNGFTRTSGDGALDQGGGGACLFYGGSICDCTVSGCSAGWGGGAICYGGGIIESSLVVGNTASHSAGGVYLTTIDDRFLCGTIASNSAPWGGGAYVPKGLIEDSLILSNRATMGGGGVYMNDCGQVLRCRIVSNQAGGGGGVMSTSTGLVENCLLSGNVATTSGGAVYFLNGTKVSFCTAVDNQAKWGGGMYAENIAHLSDSIVYFNAATNGNNTWSVTGGLTYTNVCTMPLPLTGVGLITNVPCFVNGPMGDYHLTQGSPCIDIGSVPSPVQDDLDDQLRPVDGNRDGLAIADIGAYEFVNTNQPALPESLDASQVVWTTGGDNIWFGQTNTTHDGVDAARSGAITANQQTWLETTVTGPVTVAFWGKVDSEDGCDYLSFSIDGIEKPDAISGSVGWQYMTYGIAPGVHRCRWTFSNDERYAAGANAGWVDQVQFLPPEPSISVKGINQTVIPQGSTSTSVLNGTDFGSATISSESVVRTYCLENSGGLDLSVKSVTASGPGAADFTVLDYPLTVRAGGQSNLVVRFAPTVPGYRTATLTVQSSDAVKGNYLFAVAGFGSGIYPPAPRYVWINSPSPCPPYTNWNTAAHMIQEAVDVSVAGDTVWVTNGVYSAGGHVQDGSLMNRVAINRAITVQSVNGPDVTLIVGRGPSGPEAIRCAYVTSNAVLSGFTLTNGATHTTGDAMRDMNGGGVLCDDSEVAKGLVTNCWIVCNESATFGGGASFGTLNNCTLSDNYAYFGAGVFFGELNNCELSGNYADTFDGGGACYGTLNSCTLYGNYAGEGGGAANCVLNDCLLFENSAYTDGGGGAFNCTLNNCTLVGNNAGSDGGGAHGGSLNNCVLDSNTASVDGGGAYSSMLVGCTVISNSAVISGGGARLGALTGCTLIGNSTADGEGGGAHSSALTNCTLTGNSARFGGGTYNGNQNNCLFIDNTARDFGGGSYSGSLIRCTLSGNVAQWGGGVYKGALDNCTLESNSASSAGGGAYFGVLADCVLSGNVADFGGGGIFCTLTNCKLRSNRASSSGGGVYSGTLTGCVLGGNLARWGGGVYLGTLNNCALTNNSASEEGGGSHAGVLSNCTLVNNSSRRYGGGAYEGILNNCIIYFNTALDNGNYHQSLLNYCCTTPDSGGTCNITNNPALVSAFRLSVDSPCKGAGNAAYATGSDIDGESWSVPPSMGCDEVHAGAVTGELSVAISASYTNATPGTPLEFQAQVSGLAAGNAWDFGDGTVISNRLVTSHAFLTPGLYSVVLTVINASHPDGVRATVRVLVVDQPVHYVNVSNATPVAPYTTWATAATCIQDAIDATLIPGALILVTNGVYWTGGRAVKGSLINRVAIVHSATVRSVNGPSVTIIQGCGPTGYSAVRCAYVGDHSTLSGFMLTAGNTRTSDDPYDGCGGGVRCEKSAVVSNCVISANKSCFGGGGAFSGTLIQCVLAGNCSDDNGGGAAFGTLNSCALTDNSAYGYGGGADACTLNNCTLTGNSASSNGGVNNSTVHNSIVYYNTASSGPNYNADSALYYCCTIPYPGGIGNVTNDPALSSASHLSVDSPCLTSGNADFAFGTDIDGESWCRPPSIGCDEVRAGSVTGGLSVAFHASYTNVATGFVIDFKAQIDGRATGSQWNFGDGTVVANRPFARHAYATPGLYSVVLTAMNESYPAGVSTTIQVLVVAPPVHYVNLLNSAPEPPFTTWATAAKNIQDAIDAASVPGTMVFVSNGVYSTGGRVVNASMTNRVVINNAIAVSNVNGPAVTVIQGGGALGESAVRCAYLGPNAVLSGFTLTNGHTRASGDYTRQHYGGGVWCDFSAVVSNCVISGNSGRQGGGSHNGTLYNCTLSGNSAHMGGGSFLGTLNNCALINNSATNSGGGTYGCVLNSCLLAENSALYGGGSSHGVQNNCISISNSATFGGCSYDDKLYNCKLIGNSAIEHGGGSDNSVLYNCMLFGNSTLYYGGGSSWSKLDNCTLFGNTAVLSGGGSYDDILSNCILYFNTAPVCANYDGATLNDCCTTPLPIGGLGIITEDPQLINPSGGDYRLKPTSPCIDAGINKDWMFGNTDLDGDPRIRKGRVDMGAYEFAFEANVRGLLQVPYDAKKQVMVTALSTNVPLTSPYATNRRQVEAIPPNVVDWALMEVLDTNGTLVAAASVFLDTQGWAHEATGSAGISVEASAGSYYLVLKHRNHLGAMSAQPVAFTNTVVSYDFTTGPDKYLGGTNACVELELGVWGLIGGDADGDGRITPIDKIIVQRQKGMTGYLQGDLNLDGKVDGGDE